MIVIVDDRAAVAQTYRTLFDHEGISVSDFCFQDLAGWVATAAEDDVNAIDAFLIGECEGLGGVADLIRRRCDAAVIAMRERRSLEATLELFAEGVDDVVVEPCHVREILARIAAILRRKRGGEDPDEFENIIRTYRDGRDPLVGGEPLSLPRRELRILEYLVGAGSRSVTKSQIFSSVYGLFDQDINESVIESHVCKLRRRLRFRLGYDPIESRRHLGYRLVRHPDGRCERAGSDAALSAGRREDMS